MLRQIDKIAKHANQGSKKTLYRYKQAIKGFCRFVTYEYGLQKFTNVKPKHVRAYVQHMLNAELAPSTIMNNLSALRFFYDQAGGRYRLPENKTLNLPTRHKVGVDRAWTNDEYQGLLAIAQELNRQDVIDFAILGRHMGLRIHEIARLSRTDIERAEKTGIITIKGKGGLKRNLDWSLVRCIAKEVLMRRTAAVDRGEKLFVPRGVKTHQVIKSVQNFIYDHRHQYQGDHRLTRAEEQYMRILGITQYKAQLTFHGLRHTYAREELFKRLGIDDYQDIEAVKALNKQKVRRVRLVVAKLLGHGRDDVTKVYTAGI